MSDTFRLPLDQLEENAVALRDVDKKNPQYVGLRDSIAKRGVMSSISVTPLFQGDGKTPKTTADGRPIYRIINGLHRYTASKELGLADIPVTVKANVDDAAIEEEQLEANYHVVKTQPAQFAAHIKRIMGRNQTKTRAEIAAKHSVSPQWLDKVLQLNELVDEAKPLVDSGQICLSNGADLSKLPKEEQRDWIKRAISDTAATFGSAVSDRLKEIKDNKRAGRDPNATVGFKYEAHLRNKTEVQAELENPTALPALIKAAGVTDPVEVAQFTLKWALKLDQQSVDEAKAKYENAQSERKAEAVRKAAERAKIRAEETAAEAAKVTAATA